MFKIHRPMTRQTTEFQNFVFLGSFSNKKEEALPFTTRCQDKDTHTHICAHIQTRYYSNCHGYY